MSEGLVPSRPPDFVGMMRPGPDQSIPFGLSAAPGRGVYAASSPKTKAGSDLDAFSTVG
jgi:hypothetical protein